MSPCRLSRLAALTLVTIASIGTLVPNRVLSQPIESSPENAEESPSERSQPTWVEQLNLSPGQIQQLEDIRDRYRRQMAPQQQEFQQARQELREMMASDASAQELRQKHETLVELRARVSQTRFESLLAMRQVLDAEQRRALVDLMEQQRQSRR